MKTLTKTLSIIVLIIFSIGNSFGQISLGNPQKSVKPPKNFEHIECGFRFPSPGRSTMSNSIGYSHYRGLGQGKINRFPANSVTYDIGCISLDDPPRKMKKEELVSLLNSMTKTYLIDSSEFISLPVRTVNGREIHEFETKTDFLRRIKYILDGNRVLIFIASASDERGIEKGLKLFDSVEHFSVRETVEKRMEMATQKSLPQTSAVELAQSDAERNNLKGRVKSVRVEAEDVPILVGTAERRLQVDERYDRDGNLLKSFWFQDAGYPTSVSIYGFVGGARVSDSEIIKYDTTLMLVALGKGTDNLPPPDSRYEDRYEYKFDDAKRLVERKEYDNRGTLWRIHKFTYKDDLMEEKRFDTDGKLISTKRRYFDKKGNEIKYEFWWYEQTDKEIENYSYKKFDKFGNWTERQVIKTIIDRGLTRTRTSNEFRTITYY